MHLGTWIQRALLGLTLGLVATVAVAWCIELTAPRTSDGAHFRHWDFRDPISGEETQASERVTFGCRAVVVLDGRSVMDGMVHTYEDRPPPWLPDGLQSDGLWVQQHSGWPMYTMKSGCSVEGPSRLPMWTFAVRGHDRSLSIVPIWSGFVVNVGFYAGVYFTLVSTISELRRRRRRALGTCPTCRYNLRDLPTGSPCPECGTDAAATE